MFCYFKSHSVKRKNKIKSHVNTTLMQCLLNGKNVRHKSNKKICLKEKERIIMKF